jgi:hypothetical protein
MARLVFPTTRMGMAHQSIHLAGNYWKETYAGSQGKSPVQHRLVATFTDTPCAVVWQHGLVPTRLRSGCRLKYLTDADSQPGWLCDRH